MPFALPAVSAHRGGSETAPAGTWAAFASALESGAEYVEFDVRRTLDGRLVIHHDPHAGPQRRPVGSLYHAELCELAGYPVPDAEGVMELIAGRAIGHVDLKGGVDERAVVGPAIDILGVDGFVATTESPASIRRIRAFAPAVRTALSTGSLARKWWNRPFEIDSFLDSTTEWVALSYRLASERVLRACRRGGIGVMLWTVNEPRLVTRYLADDRIDVLITDRPCYAVGLRTEMAAAYPSAMPLLEPSPA